MNDLHRLLEGHVYALTARVVVRNERMALNIASALMDAGYHIAPGGGISEVRSGGGGGMHSSGLGGEKIRGA
jgi:hypothetical protein